MSARVIRNCSSFGGAVAGSIFPPGYPSAGVVGYWPLNETSGTRRDLIGSVPFNLSTGTISSMTGKFGEPALLMPGGNQLTSSISYTIGSLCFWFLDTVVSTTYQRMLQLYTQVYPNKHFAWDAGNYDTGITATANTWYFICYVYTPGSPNTYTMYINSSSFLVDPAATQYASGAVVISDPTFSYASSAYSQLVIWNRALTPTEVATVYNGGSGIAINLSGGTPGVSPNAGKEYKKYWSFGTPAYEITRTRNRTSTERYWGDGKTEGWLFPKGLPSSKGVIIT
jgi:hypothetical protein